MPPMDLRDVQLDGRRFVSVANSADGEVGNGTVFAYHEDGDTVWAEYAGGAVVRGWLIGSRRADELWFRYLHMNSDGQTSSGRCHSRIALDEAGVVNLHESWTWESRPGSGSSLLVELDGQ